MYRISKVINNNVLVVNDAESNEFVVMGKGIGFNHKPNEFIEKSQFEKRFLLTETKDINDMVDFVNGLDVNLVKWTEEIIKIITRNLAIDYEGYEYYNLVSHLSEMINRAQNKINLNGYIDQELIAVYQNELNIANLITEYLTKQTGLLFNKMEKQMLTINLINASSEMSFTSITEKNAKIIKEIIGIIRYYYQSELSKDSFYYNRFLLHLKFLIHRHNQDTIFVDNMDTIYETIVKEYPRAFECYCLIENYLLKEYGWIMSKSEALHFIIHIEKLTN